MNPAPAPRRILGIDPGLNVTGYGIVEATGSSVTLVEAGVVRGGTAGSMAERLGRIHAGLTEVIAAHQPDVMALEQLYSHYQRPRTAILMGHARGVICLTSTQAGIPLFHYASTQIKKVLTGNGRAAKYQMQLAVQRELALADLPEPHDVADALAIALTHAYLADRQVELKSGAVPIPVPPTPDPRTSP